MNIPDRVVARILSHTEPGPGDCLLSKYSVGSHDYPQIGWSDDGERTVTLCHLALWKALRGPIPPGMTVDHRCRRKLCVNIDHYRLMTNLDNARRHSGRDWPLGQCVNGHDDAVHWHKPPSGGKGYCNACRTDRQRRRRAAARS